MPSRSASSGEPGRIGTPSSSIVPASNAQTPVSTLMSVDLPAPFCPMSALTSPPRSVRSTPSSARTPGKLRPMPRACRTGRASALIAASCAAGMSRSTCSVTTLGKFLGRRLAREDTFLGDDALRHRRACDHVLHCCHELRAEQGAALDGDIELAGQHGLEGYLDGVDRHDGDVLARFQAGFLDRL